MKVRTRKARIIFANERELWLTPHLKRVADVIVRESDENIKNGKYKAVTLEEMKSDTEKLFKELFE